MLYNEESYFNMTIRRTQKPKTHSVCVWKMQVLNIAVVFTHFTGLSVTWHQTVISERRYFDRLKCKICRHQA